MLYLIVKNGARAQTHTHTKLFIVLSETYWGPHNWVFLREHLQ